MKPRYRKTRRPDGAASQDDVVDLVDQLDAPAGAKPLTTRDAQGRETIYFTIDTGGTQVAHGQSFVPRWEYYNLKGNANVWQYAEPDDTYLYLQSSANVQVGIKVW